jgi:hypothetical protein
MPKKPPPLVLSREAAEELETIALRLRPEFMAERLWNRVLTASDQRKLGGDLQKCYSELGGTLGMWIKVRPHSNKARAVADLAKSLGIVDATTYQWLLREIGGRAIAEPTQDVPRWDAGTGELRFRGVVVLHVRPMKRPSNKQLIVVAFHKAKWRRSVANPLPGDQQQLHQALYYLNDGLKGISFHSREGGKKIAWKED